MSSLPDYTRDRVWVTDRVAGLAYPIHKDHADLQANPDRYTVDPKHPVVDDRGRLLPAKPTQTPPTKTTKPADAGKE